MSELGQALEELSEDKNIGCIVLTGGDRAFAGLYLMQKDFTFKEKI